MTETLQVARRCHGSDRDYPSVTTLSRLRPRLSKCHDAVTATTETLQVPRRCHGYNRDSSSVTTMSRLRPRLTLQVSRRCHGYDRNSPSVTTLSRLRPRLSKCHDAVTAATEAIQVSRRCHGYDRCHSSVKTLSRLWQNFHHSITATGISTQLDRDFIIRSCISTITPVSHLSQRLYT